jgi:hypothetical protein
VRPHLCAKSMGGRRRYGVVHPEAGPVAAPPRTRHVEGVKAVLGRILLGHDLDDGARMEGLQRGLWISSPYCITWMKRRHAASLPLATCS